MSAPVAQWIEQLPSKPLVAGSSPVGRAKFFFLAGILETGQPFVDVSPLSYLENNGITGDIRNGSVTSGGF